MDIPRLPKESLKEIVREYIAGQVFFSAQVQDPNDIPMVFMPIAMGGFSYPEPMPKGTEKPEAPTRPGRPTPPNIEPSQLEIKLLGELQQNAETLDSLGFRLRWETPTEEEESQLETLRATQKSLLARVKELRETTISDGITLHRQNLANYLVALRAYRAERKAWRAQVATWEEGEVGLLNRQAAWKVGQKAWYDALDQNLGVIYAPMRDASARSINGYPCFFSCAMLHKKDWEIVHKAIDRELERQKDIDLGDDESPEGSP